MGRVVLAAVVRKLGLPLASTEDEQMVLSRTAQEKMLVVDTPLILDTVTATPPDVVASPVRLVTAMPLLPAPATN